MAPSTNRHESTPELQRPLKTTDSSGCCCCLSVNSLPSIWFGIGAVSLQVLKGPNVFVFTCISYPFVFCLFGFILPGVHYLAEWEDLFRVHGLQVQHRNQYMGTESVRRASRSRPSPFTHSSFCFRLQIRYVSHLHPFTLSTQISKLKQLHHSNCVTLIGNLANDGFRLGRRLDLEMDLDLPRSRNRDPLITSGSACGAAWRHCPPLGPTLHVIIALCSLMAKVVLEARFIKDGISPRGRKLFFITILLFVNNYIL